MTRYVIDAPAAIEIARRNAPVPEQHSLVAPSRLRSDALALLYAAVRRGEVPAAEARRLLERITALRIRLLGDRVSRATAWRIAEELDADDTADAEYVAVTRLQADAFVTLDPDLAGRVRHLVAIAPLEALTSP